VGSENAPASSVEQCRNGSFNRWLRGNDEVLSKHPLAFDLDISLIDAPGIAPRLGVPALAFLQLRDVALHLPQDGRVGYGDAAFGHHLDQVTGTELERQVAPRTGR
jgi:hypothetical protein